MTDQHRTVASAPGQPQGIPPELLLRRDRTMRYERGGSIYATDGLVGTLKQVVVDQAAAEVTALVVAVEGTSNVVLMPPELIDKTAGSAVFLTIDRAQFYARAPQARQFEKSHFVKVNVKALLSKVAPVGRRDPRRVIARVERDVVETPAASHGDRTDAPNLVRIEGAA